VKKGKQTSANPVHVNSPYHWGVLIPFFLVRIYFLDSMYYSFRTHRWSLQKMDPQRNGI